MKRYLICCLVFGFCLFFNKTICAQKKEGVPEHVERVYEQFSGNWNAIRTFEENVNGNRKEVRYSIEQELNEKWGPFICRKSRSGKSQRSLFSIGHVMGNEFTGNLIKSGSGKQSLFKGSYNKKSNIFTFKKVGNDSDIKVVMYFPDENTRVEKLISLGNGKEVVLSKTVFKRAESDWCLIQIDSNPKGAKIFVNNKEWGKTNRMGFSKTGIYKIRIEKPGYKTLVKTANFVKYTSNNYNFTLEKKKK